VFWGEYLYLRRTRRKEQESRENCMKSFIICALHQIILDDQIKEDEIGGNVARI
jgi:hypothetical protein